MTERVKCVKARDAASGDAREEALTRLPSWERAFWEMLQESKAGRGVHEKRMGDGYEGGGEPEMGPAAEGSTR